MGVIINKSVSNPISVVDGDTPGVEQQYALGFLGDEIVLSGPDELTGDTQLDGLQYRWVFSRLDNRGGGHTFTGQNYRRDGFNGSLRREQDQDPRPGWIVTPVTVPDAPVPRIGWFSSARGDGAVTVDTDVVRTEASLTLRVRDFRSESAYPNDLGGSMWWRKFVYAAGVDADRVETPALAAWDFLVVYAAVEVVAPRGGAPLSLIGGVRSRTVTVANIRPMAEDFNPGNGFTFSDVSTRVDEITGRGGIAFRQVDFVDWVTAIAEGIQVAYDVGDDVGFVAFTVSYRIAYRFPHLTFNLDGVPIHVRLDLSDPDPAPKWRNNVIVGTGELFLDVRRARSLPDMLKPEALDGERYLGSVTSVTLATSTDRLRVMSGGGKLAKLLASSVVRLTQLLQIEIQDMAMDNMALLALTEGTTERVSAARPLEEKRTVKTLDRWYQLEAPLGPGPVTALTVTASGDRLVAGVDYQADLRRGRIYFPAGGTVAAGDSVTAAATARGRTTRCVEAGVAPTPMAAIRYLETPTRGVQGRDWYWPLCALLESNMTALVARDREQRIVTQWAVLRPLNGAYAPTYVDGEARSQPIELHFEENPFA